MSKKQKYYVVWDGHQTGVFDSWEACKLQINGFKGAKYKSFSSKQEAVKAFDNNYSDYITKANKKQKQSLLEVNNLPVWESISVDAACSGNPGMMEYQGVETNTGKRIFHFGPVSYGTNNIGEFLALVHGLAHLKKLGSELPIYSDSKIAMAWINAKKCRTKLELNPNTQKLHSMIQRAENWLATNQYKTRILKWETKQWGEIPADFGRK